MFNQNHPELRDGEVFVGNHHGGDDEVFSKLTTVRLGTVAYDIYGEVVTNDPNCHPMFIHSSEREKYNRIREATFNAIRKGYYKGR